MKKLADLNYRHLFYFWMVAKEGHLTRVADQLNTSQSALSIQIRLLEDEVGHQLFLRAQRKMKLTEVGRIVLKYAESIFALGIEMIASLNAGEGQGVQQLCIGSVATLSRNFQDNFIKPVLPIEHLELVLESGSLEELLQRLEVHKLHLVLSNRAVARAEERAWRCRRIARQPVCLVGKPMTQFKFPESLATTRLIVPSFHSEIRTAFDLLCDDLSIKTKFFAQVDDMAMIRLLARDSDCVALVPEVVVQDELQSGILKKFCVVPRVYENFYAITTERQFQPKVLKHLLSHKSV